MNFDMHHGRRRPADGDPFCLLLQMAVLQMADPLDGSRMLHSEQNGSRMH
jgi:hypothetical protein